MMKSKWFVVSLLLIVAMAMAACQSGTATTEEPDDVVTDEATEVMEPTDEATAEMTEEAAAGDIDCMGAAEGDEVTLVYQWSGVEEESFLSILEPLVDECGIVFSPEATRDAAILDTRVQGGNPPDIAFWNVTSAQQYADQVIPVSELGANLDNYESYWNDLATFDGTQLAVPVKIDIKTIIWYSPAAFDAFGYEVPTTWDELDALVEQMVADGNTPWSMGLESGTATGWTGSDFIQDIMLVQQGPDYVLGLIDGTVPYNDAGVAQAYETYGKWATDGAYTVGGAQGTLSTSFSDALLKPFADPAEAMMVKQSGFTGGEVQKAFPDLEYGVDYDFFGVPDAQGVQGGADWMFAFSDEPAVQAVFAYLTSDAGGQAWAEASFGVSPNLAAQGQYSDPALQKFDEILASASGFTPDIGDNIPGGFGAAEWEAIVGYINGGDLQSLLDTAAEVQAAATAE